MGIQEREIMELYREMQAERHGAKLTSDGLATLTAARILKRTMEKCTLEVCGSIDQLCDKINSFDFTLTLRQADAIIDMSNHGFSGGLYPETEEACQGWGELLEQARAITNRSPLDNGEMV